MVGLIQRILFTMVSDRLGEGAVAELKRRAGVAEDKYFEMCVAYPDEEWKRLFEAACGMIELPLDEIIREFSRYFIDDAIRRWPTWFQMAKSSRDFLKLQPLIHNSFASGVVDPTERRGVEDKFRIEEAPGELIVHYRSKNHLCSLYKCLAHRIADHYRDPVLLDEPLCQERGDHECEIHVRFLSEGNS